MNSNYFYNQIEEETATLDWVKALKDYSVENQIRIYLLRYPVVDSDHPDYDRHFLLLAPGYKICIIEEPNNEDFEDYKEDVIGEIEYLYRKYDYRKAMNLLFTKIKENFIVSKQVSDFENKRSFFDDIRLETPEECRKSELIISLCIGSVNEITKVGVSVPTTLVEKVRRKIQLFDADQSRFIFDVKNQKVIKIQGLSGTGKTELLLHKLKELYSLSDDVKIFFTCHNRVLATELSLRIQKFFNYMKVQTQIEWNKRLWCANAWGRSYDFNSGLYRYICHLYNLPFYPFNYHTKFSDVCKIAVKALKDKSDVCPFFDYLIVDESQDFDDSFVELCQMVTKNQILSYPEISRH